MVFEYSDPGTDALASRIAKAPAFLAEHDHPPRIVVVYHSYDTGEKAKRVFQFRKLIMRDGNLDLGKLKTSARRERVRLVEFSESDWKLKVQHMKKLGRADIVCFYTYRPVSDKVGADRASAAMLSVNALARARAHRDRILAQGEWFSSSDVASGASDAASNPSQYASALRQQKKLFGVRHRGHYLHPGFQFSPAGELRPEVADLLAVLPNDDNGWAAAFWLFQRTGRLGGRKPVEVFSEDAETVIDAAKKDFVSDDENW